MDSKQDRYPSRTFGRVRVSPRKDPVLWGGEQAPGPLNVAQLRQFDEQGFVKVDEVLTPKEVSLLTEELEALRADADQGGDPVVIAERNSDEVRSTFMIHAINLTFGRLCRHPFMLGAAQQILHDELYIHQSRLNYKPGFDGKEFYWHSDFETWHVEDGMPNMRAISCVVPLTENYSFNGPLMLIPGSHKQFVACVGETPDDHYEQSLKKQEYGVPDREELAALAASGGIEVPDVQPGSVLFFDCNTMHGSNGNITPFPRSNAFFVYNSLQNQVVQPFGGQPPRPEFIASRETVAPLDPVEAVVA